MKESLYSKLFKLFQLDSYFRHAVLVPLPWKSKAKRFILQAFQWF